MLAVDQYDNKLTAMAGGKRRLLQAALQLSAQGSPLSSLGIRELAREAKLNHNTFYRHFSDIEDLARQAAEHVGMQIMDGMKKVRENAARHDDATVGAVEFLLDYVAENPAPFVAGLRELHGGPPNIRHILRDLLEQIAEQSVEQLRDMGAAPSLDRQALLQVTRPVTYYMFYRTLDFIDEPQQRPAITAEMVTFIRQQFLGAITLAQMRSQEAKPKP